MLQHVAEPLHSHEEERTIQPPTVNHFIGQQDVVARFRVALEAAWNDAARLPHMLLVGPPGTGKTTLANIAASELAVELHEVLGQCLADMSSVNGLLMKARSKDIVFIDEAHEIPKQMQTVLYRAMEDGRIFVSGRNDQTMPLPVEDFTLLAATTDEYSLLPPLRDRFKLVLPFQFYAVPSLAKIGRQAAAMREIVLDPGVAENIALRSRGTPRLAIRLLEACHRFARSQGDHEVTQRHFEATVKLEQLDELGLGIDEQRYLRLLAENPGQPVRLTNLEASLGVHRRTLQTVIEPFLLRAGLIERCEKGRVITTEGMRHLGLVNQPRVSVA